jgi:hypothetical protein
MEILSNCDQKHQCRQLFARLFFIFLTGHEDKKVQKLLEVIAKKKSGRQRDSAGTEERISLGTRYRENRLRLLRRDDR